MRVFSVHYDRNFQFLTKKHKAHLHSILLLIAHPFILDRTESNGIELDHIGLTLINFDQNGQNWFKLSKIEKNSDMVLTKWC